MRTLIQLPRRVGGAEKEMIFVVMVQVEQHILFSGDPGDIPTVGRMTASISCVFFVGDALDKNQIFARLPKFTDLV